MQGSAEGETPGGWLGRRAECFRRRPEGALHLTQERPLGAAAGGLSVLRGLGAHPAAALGADALEVVAEETAEAVVDGAE